jgi:serine protease AprX
MTVGAIDDKATTAFGDDVPASWSSFGTTQDGFTKPELLTPGRNIISVIDTNSILYKTTPSNVVDSKYFRLSGTSMAAGVMSGVGALVLQRHPDWTPGQLKCTLRATGRQLSSPNNSFMVPRAGAASNLTTPSCNSDAGLAPSTALAPMMKAAAVAFVLDQPSPSTTASAIGMDLAPAGLQNATLATVDWSAIKWDAIKWDAIKWDAIKWDAIKWDAIKWSAIKWDMVSPDGVNFSAITWSAIKWSAIKWDAIKWSAIKWDAIKWDAIKWDAIKWNVRLD